MKLDSRQHSGPVFRVPGFLIAYYNQILISCRKGFTCPSLPCMHIPFIYNMHFPCGARGAAGSLSLSGSFPHLSQKVCRQGRTLGHRYRSRQILHTRNCLSIGCTSGPGLSSLFAMVTTDGSCHSHQPVYREIVSSREASSPSPHTISCREMCPFLPCQGQDKVVAGRAG